MKTGINDIHEGMKVRTMVRMSAQGSGRRGSDMAVIGATVVKVDRGEETFTCQFDSYDFCYTYSLKDIGRIVHLNDEQEEDAQEAAGPRLWE